MAFPTHTTGTISIAANATAAVGSGTIWSGINARPGDWLVVGGSLTVVSDVTDGTHLVIPPWQNAAQSGAAYTLFLSSPLRFAGAQAMADVSKLIAALAVGPVFVGPSLSAPDPSYGNEGQYAFQPTTQKLWIMTAGVWVYQTTLTGLLAANNLSEVASAATARTNLGAAGLADANVFSADQTFGAGGSATVPYNIKRKGSSGAGGGARDIWCKDAVTKWQHGFSSAIDGGGTSDNLQWYSQSLGKVLELNAATGQMSLAGSVASTGGFGATNDCTVSGHLRGQTLKSCASGSSVIVTPPSGAWLMQIRGTQVNGQTAWFGVTNGVQPALLGTTGLWVSGTSPTYFSLGWDGTNFRAYNGFSSTEIFSITLVGDS